MCTLKILKILLTLFSIIKKQDIDEPDIPILCTYNSVVSCVGPIDQDSLKNLNILTLIYLTQLFIWVL